MATTLGSNLYCLKHLNMDLYGIDRQADGHIPAKEFLFGKAADP